MFCYNQWLRGNIFPRKRANMKIVRFSGISAGGRLPAVLLFLLPAVVWCAEPAAERPARDPSQCELVVEGKDVESIVLVPAQGTPGLAVQNLSIQQGVRQFLPQGNYDILSITLRGGYQSYNNGSLTLTPNLPCKLAVGTPLKSSVKVERQGRFLKLDYQLRDAQGRNYTIYYTRDRGDPPRFVVYQGNRKIGSGNFQYG